MVWTATYSCQMHHLFKVCLNTGYLTTPTRLTVSVVTAAAGCQLRDKHRIQWHWRKWTKGELGNYTQRSEQVSGVNCFIPLHESPCHGAVREPENVKWPDIYLPSLFSLSPSVSHSGKEWLFSQDAQLPQGGLFIVGWRICLTLAPGSTLSWRRLCPAGQQPWMMLPGKQDYVAITGFGVIFCGDQIHGTPTTRPLGGLWDSLQLCDLDKMTWCAQECVFLCL